MSDKRYGQGDSLNQIYYIGIKKERFMEHGGLLRFEKKILRLDECGEFYNKSLKYYTKRAHDAS